MNKYIVTIKRGTALIPLTLKAEGELQAISNARSGYKCDAVVGIELHDTYKKRMSKLTTITSGRMNRGRTTKRGWKD